MKSSAMNISCQGLSKDNKYSIYSSYLVSGLGIFSLCPLLLLLEPLLGGGG